MHQSVASYLGIGRGKTGASKPLADSAGSILDDLMGPGAPSSPAPSPPPSPI